MHPSDIPDIRARELLTVLALAEYGSFVAAAAYLKTSQPALTRTIKRVERVLGVTLFARNTRRVEITTAGREFVAVAERMLNDLKHTVRNLSEVTNEQRGRITIATYSAFAVNPLPGFVRRYRETRPLIELRIREGRQSEIVEDVRNGGSDFGIGYVNALPELMESIPLRKEPLHVLIPLSHPLAAKKRPRIRLAELRDEPLVSAPNDTFLRRLTDAAAVSAGFNLHYSVTVDRLLSIVPHVCAGVGIAILPAGCVPSTQWGEGFHSAQLTEPSLSVAVGLITTRGRYLTPAASGMVSLIREQMVKHAKA
ncbi:MAG TPA: LysR family transcriptional regulator [Vicinamibacterales bacterium]|nr:LysR family transcriptional regulator [Vicinamibacterales bacterium]